MRRVCFVLLLSMIATLLAGAAFAQSTLLPRTDPIVVEGTITAISFANPLTSAIVTVQPARLTNSTAGNAPVKFLVNEKSRVYKDGKEAKFTALTITDECRVSLLKMSDGGLFGQLIYAKTVVPPMKWVKGTITDKQVTSAWGRTFKLAVPAVGTNAATLMWFAVGDKTRVLVDGKPANYDQLAVGQIAEVAFVPPPPSPLTVVQPILASIVSAKSPPLPPISRIVGRLVKMDPTSGFIAVAPLNSTGVITFQVDNLTKIDKFGQAALAALVPASSAYAGDMLEVTARLSPADTLVIPVALSIVVQPETFGGVVHDRIVDPNGVTGTLLMRAGASITVDSAVVAFRIVPNTKIYRNGVPVRLDRLLSGDIAKLKYFQFKDAKVAALVEASSVIRVVAPIAP